MKKASDKGAGGEKPHFLDGEGDMIFGHSFGSGPHGSEKDLPSGSA
jgi:hypothetical protein